jgi:hypothetical protein
MGIPYFSPGITVGHPLYSALKPADLDLILRSVQTGVRKDFGGKLGVGLCCTTATTVQPTGYNYLLYIPTPEFSQDTIEPLGQQLFKKYKMAEQFTYDKTASQVTPIVPVTK